MRLYISGKSSVKSEKDISVDDFVEMVHKRNVSGIDSVLSQGTGRNIPLLQQFVFESFGSDLLIGSDYWFLVQHLLRYDRRIYRRPITEAAEKVSNFAMSSCDPNQFDEITRLMIEDKDKVFDGLRFLKVFKSLVSASLYDLILSCSESINIPEGFSCLYEILDFSTEEKIDHSCKIATPASLYSLYKELSLAEEMYGIWHIQGLPNFPDRLNELPDTFEVQIILDLIEKNVLHEDIEDSTGHLAETECGGYDTFFRLAAQHNAKAAYKRNIQSIGSYVGKTVDCRMKAKYRNHYLVQLMGRFGLPGLLPINMATHKISINDAIKCTVVGVVKSQHLLLLTQKACKKTQIERIPVITVGEVCEAKFSLYNKKINAELLGYGPVRARLKSIPHNFDYKRHHMVRIVSTHIASCEIVIID